MYNASRLSPLCNRRIVLNRIVASHNIAACRVALCLILAGALGTITIAQAQQQATIGGRIETLGELPAQARVGLHIIDPEGSTLSEVVSTMPVGGVFNFTTVAPDAAMLQPFNSTVLLPGLQSDYTVSPPTTRHVRAIAKVYDDTNGNGRYDNPELDPIYLGVASVENPIGFFIFLYVDQPSTLSGRGESLALGQGWNVFNVRFPEEGTRYTITNDIRDILLDIIIGE